MGPHRRLFIGLDLGQAQDYTALAVLERTRVTAAQEGRHAVRHLHRWPLGTSYPAIVADVARVARQLETTYPLPQLEIGEGFSLPQAVATMVVDATGVGRPVVDLLRQARLPCRVLAVTITAGHTVSGGPGWVHVPKKELVSALQVLLQSRRLKIAEELSAAPMLARELTTFQTKITLAGNETFGAWREGAHDDLVLSVALAAWFAENEPEPFAGPLVWNLEDEEEDSQKPPRNRTGQILDDLGIDLEGDW